MLTSRYQWKIVFLFVVTLSLPLLHVQCHRFHKHHKGQKPPGADEELRRTKRNVFQALLMKRYSEKRADDYEQGIPLDDNVYTTTARPFIQEQVQNASIQIRLYQEWREEMLNNSSPEFQLLAGNAIDAIANEFTANPHYLSAKVTKLQRPTNDTHEIIANITMTFFKTEDDPVKLLERIVATGWIGGQKVDPGFYKVTGTSNGNQEQSKWHYPEDLQLRVRPAMRAPDNVSHYLRFHKNLTTYKEIRISIKLKQRFTMFLQDRSSPEYSSLSGNIEEAVMKVFAHDSLFFDAEVIEFRESPEGRVVVRCALQFKLEEKYAIEKCQAMISSGDLEGMPVDDRFFVIDALTEYGAQIVIKNHTQPVINTTMKTTEYMINNTPPVKPKPSRYKDLRVTIKIKEAWRDGLESNETNDYSIYSANMEGAVDRSFADDVNYIDSTVLEFLESREHEILLSLSIRFKLEEINPEQKFRDAIKDGSLSGVKVDPNFFYVFALSETTHPNMMRNQSTNTAQPLTMQRPTSTVNNINEQPGSPAIINNEQPVASGNAHNVSTIGNVNGPPVSTGNTNYGHPVTTTTNINGQKQPADNSIFPLIQQINELRPQNIMNTSRPTSQSTDTNATVPIIPYSQRMSTTVIPATPQASIMTTAAPAYLPKNTTISVDTRLPTNTSITPAANNEAVNTTSEQPFLNSEKESQGSNDNQAENNTVEGSMILEQSWRPELANTSSQLYFSLEKSVDTAVKAVYAEVNEPVVPQVLGFSEINVPGTSLSVSTENKIGVRFKVLFTTGHKADAGPLERAISSKSVAGMMIHENSLVVVASNDNQNQRGNDEAKMQLTLCQEQQKEAESVSEGSIGGFIPQCNSDGSYKLVQCHALTGYCWCVNNVGVRIQGSEEKYKEPNCNGIKFHGRVILPEHSPRTLLPNSCMTISIQEMISCGGDVNCHIPLVANKTFEHLQVEDHSVKYELNTPVLKPGRYSLSATINVGWCRKNSYLSKDLIHPGDYHTAVMQPVVIETDTHVVNEDIQVDVMLPEETGVLLHGKAILPAENPLAFLPNGSCLSIKTKLLNVCSGSECPIYPVYGNATITDLEVENNTIPYAMQMPALDPGTYVISAVLHVGKCSDADQTMVPGDYFNDVMHDYVVSSETTDIEKDITLVKLKDARAGGVFVSGRVLLPTFEEILQPNSCLTVSSRKLIQCKNNNCKIPPVATKVFENINNDRGVPYSILLPVATPGKYIISAVINNGWCKLNDLKDWIHPGDFYNNRVHDFEIKPDTLVVGKNIDVEKFTPEKPKTGITIHGRLILPKNSNDTFSTKSCVTIKAQEFKLCGGGVNCINPLTAKETVRNFQLENHMIPYAITIPSEAKGHFIISAVLNIDWCKDDDPSSQDFIHNGDYHNEDIHDFVITEGMNEVEKDITMEEYNEIVTAAPTTDRLIPSSKAMTYMSTETPNTNFNPHSKDSDMLTTPKPSQRINSESLGTARILKSEITTPNSAAEVKPSTKSSPISREELIKLLVTTEQPHGPPIYDTKQPITIGVGQLYPIISEEASSPPLQTMTEPSTSVNTTQIPVLSTPQLEDLITLPEGLPKSCEEIRQAGIGTQDGQYIIEARSHCHLSIICQDMGDKERVPKEFLGGPSEAEWRYWHYAVLIKLSFEDKLNIPSGACLEKTEAGKDLIKRILEAGARQGNPIADWHTNIAQMLSKRGKRNIHAGRTVITKAFKIYKYPKDKRSENEINSKWGVL